MLFPLWHSICPVDVKFKHCLSQLNSLQNKVLYLIEQKCYRNLWKAPDGLWINMYEPSICFFYWHKKFKYSKEEVKNNERCGMEKDLRTSLLLEKICNFLDEAHYVFIKTIRIQFGVGVAQNYSWRSEHMQNYTKVSSQGAQWWREGKTCWWHQGDGWKASKLSLTFSKVQILISVIFGCSPN